MPKLPPQNIEAESSVLGSLLIDKEAIMKVTDILSAQDFYTPAHAHIYQAILELYEKHLPIDLLTITNRLKEQNLLTDIGGSAYLTKLIDSVPTASHVEHYAKLVKEKKVLRDLIATGASITENAFHPTEDLETILDEIEQKIFAISQRTMPQKFTAIKDELQTAYERIERLHRGEGNYRGIPTGFKKLDNIISGLQQSDLVIIGGRPSLGKTSFVLDMLRHIAVNEKKPVALFSLEMSREQVIDRLIAAQAGVPLWKLRTGKLSSDTDFTLIQHALDILSQSPFYIDDTPSPNILQMRSMARRLQMQYGLSAIAVDYLQLIQPRASSDNTVQQITEISRGLKSLAREINVPVLALSQLSRAVEQRGNDSRPKLSDLRDSGSIEQDADIVMFLYRKDRDKITLSPEEENTAEVIVAKHRNGPLGTVPLKFDPDTVSFKEIDMQRS